jgi:release factor glutamine methyltransferase
LLARWKEKLDEVEAQHFTALLERRRAGEPIQYITGETEFFGLPLRVTPDVLIPRPETEHVVEKAIAIAAQFPQPRIVDVGAGSGAIAIALAHQLLQAGITATDISAPALAIAKENATRIGVADRIQFAEGDLLAPVAGETFDFVVSNPPYVAESDRAMLAVEVRDYEPATALFAGEDGLSIYRRLIPAAWTSLAPGGFLVVEIGYGQAESLRSLLSAHGYEKIEFTPDLQGIPRVASAQRAYPASR